MEGCHKKTDLFVEGEGQTATSVELNKGEALEGKQIPADSEGCGDAKQLRHVRRKGLNSTDPTPGTPLLNKTAPEYLARLLEEKRGLGALPNSFDFKHLTRLVDEEISKVRTGLGDASGGVQACGDATTPKLGRRVVLQDKVFVPVHEYPEYNFVGRILGPRGMTAKQLEEETGCRIMIRGRGSTRDEEAQKSGNSNPKEELHVLVQCEDYEPIAKAKLKHALECVRLMLKPPRDGEDELKRHQLMQLAIINGTYRPTNTLKLTLQNQGVLPQMPLYGYPLNVPSSGTAITPEHSTAANQANNDAKSYPFDAAAGSNMSSMGGAASLGLVTDALGGSDTPKRYIRSNAAVNSMAEMTSPVLQSTQSVTPQLLEQLSAANVWNPQLATAVLSGIVNNPGIVAKEYYKHMLAGAQVCSPLSAGLAMTGGAAPTASTPNVPVRPVNLQGYLTAASMLTDAPSTPSNLKHPR